MAPVLGRELQGDWVKVDDLFLFYTPISYLLLPVVSG